MRWRVTGQLNHGATSAWNEGLGTRTCGAPATRWLWTSIVLTCGALAACVVLAPKSGASPDVGLAWLLFLGSSVHVASTGWLFTNPDVRRYALERRGRYVWAPFGLLATGMILSVAASARLMAWAVLLLLAWQFHHFQKQNLGQVALTGASLGLASLRRGERTAICTTGAAGIAEICAHPGLLQLDVRLPLNGYLALLATALLAAGVAGGTLALTRRPRSDRPVGFCIMYGLALLFPLPVFVFTSPYAAVGGLTMAHGLQYLLLMGLVAAGNDRRKRIGGVAALCAIAFLGGVVLNVISHLHGDGQSLRLFFGVYLGLLAGHFVVDAGMWRLREPFVRSFLSQRVGYLVCSGPASRAVSVDDRSVTDIESLHGPTAAAGSKPT
jgi:hypothetical protein